MNSQFEKVLEDIKATLEQNREIIPNNVMGLNVMIFKHSKNIIVKPEFEETNPEISNDALGCYFGFDLLGTLGECLNPKKNIIQ